MKLRLISTIALIALFVLSNLPLFAQASDREDDPLKFKSKRTKIYLGPLAGYNRSMHTADLASFADDELCPNFSEGTSNGFFFGLFYEHNFGEPVDSKHAVIGKIVYNTFPASFETGGSTYPSLVDDITAPDGVSVVNTTTKHTLVVDYSTLSIEIIYRWNIAYELGVCVGPVFDIPMTKTKTQKYMLIKPDNVQFKKPDNWEAEGLKYEDNDRTIIVHDGEIDGANSIRFGLKLGVQYEILLGTGIDVIPGVFYNLGLTKVSSTQSDWTVNAVQAGIDIRFAL